MVSQHVIVVVLKDPFDVLIYENTTYGVARADAVERAAQRQNRNYARWIRRVLPGDADAVKRLNQEIVDANA